MHILPESQANLKEFEAIELFTGLIDRRLMKPARLLERLDRGNRKPSRDLIEFSYLYEGTYLAETRSVLRISCAELTRNSSNFDGRRERSRER